MNYVYLLISLKCTLQVLSSSTPSILGRPFTAKQRLCVLLRFQSQISDTGVFTVRCQGCQVQRMMWYQREQRSSRTVIAWSCRHRCCTGHGSRILVGRNGEKCRIESCKSWRRLPGEVRVPGNRSYRVRVHRLDSRRARDANTRWKTDIGCHSTGF